MHVLRIAEIVTTNFEMLDRKAASYGRFASSDMADRDSDAGPRKREPKNDTRSIDNPADFKTDDRCSLAPIKSEHKEQYHMFDLARLTEGIGGVLGQSAANIEASNRLEHLNAADLNVGELQQLDPDHLITTLCERGIDIAGLDLAELTALAEQSGFAELPDWLSQLPDNRS